MENPLKDCLTIQVSEEDGNSPDFDLSNYMNKKIKEMMFKKALEFEQTQTGGGNQPGTGGSELEG